MNSTEFNSMLYSRFPDLKLLANERLAFFGEETPGVYITFEQILVPAIDEAARNASPDLERLMEFVEEIATNHDRNLVVIGLGEWVHESKNAHSIIAAAGPNTREAIELAERERIKSQRASESSPIISALRRLVTGRKQRQ